MVRVRVRVIFWGRCVSCRESNSRPLGRESDSLPLHDVPRYPQLCVCASATMFLCVRACVRTCAHRRVRPPTLPHAHCATRHGGRSVQPSSVRTKQSAGGAGGLTRPRAGHWVVGSVDDDGQRFASHMICGRPPRELTPVPTPISTRINCMSTSAVNEIQFNVLNIISKLTKLRRRKSYLILN